MPSVIVFPFHQDDRLSHDSIVLPPTVTSTFVEPPLPAADQWQRLTTLYDGLATQVAASVATADLTTVVTGDCLAVLGTLAGTQRAGLDPSIVWFDAHGDVHTLASSTSGYLGGMALRMAMGADAAKLGAPLGLRPVAEESVVLVGARDLDPAEVSYLATADVRQRSVEELRPADLPDGPVIVHVDLDVIDPGALPGLRFPAPGGPSPAAVIAALHRLIDTGRVTVLDIACPWYEPVDDAERETRRALLTALFELLPPESVGSGHRRS